jgi:hypothetical protein
MKSIVKKAREIVTQLYERNMVAWNDLDREVVFAIQALIAEVQRMEALAQPEPVGRFAKFTDGIWREVTDGSAGVALYTTPPQLKPLTDQQIDQIADEFIVDYRIPAGSHYDFAQAIEAAHSIKE